MVNKNRQRDIRWWVPKIGAAEKAFVNRALDADFPNEGRLTSLFEKKIADLLGVRYAVMVTSCTAAIFLALKALKIGAGDEVIVPDITFIATANAVEMCGATPVLVDIDPATMNMSPDAFERAITKRTKAVIPVYVSGRAGCIESIAGIAARKGINVVEDAAEALASKYKGRCLGTIGELGCFSFSPHKIITTGQGGAVVTNSNKMNIRLRELKDQGRPRRGTGGDDTHNVIGYNFKFTDIQAAVGLGQLTYLGSRLKRMKEIYLKYLKNLKGAEGIDLFLFNTGQGESPQWVDAIVDRRDAMDRYLRVRGIECRRYWFPVHTQLPYRISDKKFPNSVRLSPKALWLPSSFMMPDSDIDTVCGYIKEFLSCK